MVLHSRISPGGWTIGPLVATVQRRSLIPSTWSRSWSSSWIKWHATMECVKAVFWSLGCNKTQAYTPLRKGKFYGLYTTQLRFPFTRRTGYNRVLSKSDLMRALTLREWAGQLRQYSVWLRAGRLGDRGSIPGRGERIFPLTFCVQNGSGAHPASCTMGTGDPFPGAKERPGRDADHSPHLVPRSRMSRSYISSPPKRLRYV
jgi:hypothetical protein